MYLYDKRDNGNDICGFVLEIAIVASLISIKY
jgi:hypothetical protein